MKTLGTFSSHTVFGMWSSSFPLISNLENAHCLKMTRCFLVWTHCLFFLLSCFRLLAIEEDLRQEQQEMKSAISRKEQIIDSQERRIRELDAANNKLQKTLTDMKDRVTRKAESKQQTYKTTLYVNDYNKSSFC